MKFILKSGEEITVNRKNRMYIISEESKQDELNHYVFNPPLMAGTYAFEKVNWTCIVNIVCNYIYNREVVEIIPEQNEIIEEIPFEEGRIY